MSWYAMAFMLAIFEKSVFRGGFLLAQQMKASAGKHALMAP